MEQQKKDSSESGGLDLKESAPKDRNPFWNEK